MSTVALILPDFLLIALGFALRRATPLGAELWPGIEKLTYFVLFPALLFYANARTRIDLGAAAALLAAVLAALAAGMALGSPARRSFAPRGRCSARRSSARSGSTPTSASRWPPACSATPVSRCWRSRSASPCRS
jgi:predicted permease